MPAHVPSMASHCFHTGRWESRLAWHPASFYRMQRKVWNLKARPVLQFPSGSVKGSRAKGLVHSLAHLRGSRTVRGRIVGGCAQRRFWVSLFLDWGTRDWIPGLIWNLNTQFSLLCLFCPCFRELVLLHHRLQAWYFTTNLEQQGQWIMESNLWNHEPKQTFPKRIISGISFSNRKWTHGHDLLIETQSKFDDKFWLKTISRFCYDYLGVSAINLGRGQLP